MLWAHVEEPPPTVTQERPDLPPEVDDVVALGDGEGPGTRARRPRARSLPGSARRCGSSRRRRRCRRRPKATRAGETVAGRWLVAAVGALRASWPLASPLLLVRWRWRPDRCRQRTPRSHRCEARLAFTTSLQVGEDPTGVAIGEDGDVWVINQGDSTVNRIEPENRRGDAREVHARDPDRDRGRRGRCLDQNGFGSQSGTQVVRVDPADDSVEVAFPSDNAKAIVVAFDSIWLADADRDRVLRYDPEDLIAPSRP